MNLAPCETCGQRVGVLGPDTGEPRRVVRHKTMGQAGRFFTRVDWCSGEREKENGMRPVWEPRADKHDPPVTDHGFERWEYPTGRVICIHRYDSGRICDRPEDEHAPASTSSETGA